MPSVTHVDWGPAGSAGSGGQARSVPSLAPPTPADRPLPPHPARTAHLRSTAADHVSGVCGAGRGVDGHRGARARRRPQNPLPHDCAGRLQEPDRAQPGATAAAWGRAGTGHRAAPPRRAATRPCHQLVRARAVPHTHERPPPPSCRQAFMFHTISVYGDAEGWNIAFYIFTALRSLLFFVVIILLATGAEPRCACPALRCAVLPCAQRCVAAAAAATTVAAAAPPWHRKVTHPHPPPPITAAATCRLVLHEALHLGPREEAAHGGWVGLSRALVAQAVQGRQDGWRSPAARACRAVVARADLLRSLPRPPPPVP